MPTGVSLIEKTKITDVGEDVEKRKSCTVGRTVNWKTVCRFLEKLRIQLPYDPVIPLLGIYLKNMKILI